MTEDELAALERTHAELVYLDDAGRYELADQVPRLIAEVRRLRAACEEYADEVERLHRDNTILGAHIARALRSPAHA